MPKNGGPEVPNCISDCQAACCRFVRLSGVTYEQAEFYRAAGKARNRPVEIEGGEIPGTYDIIIGFLCPFIVKGNRCDIRHSPLRAQDCTDLEPGSFSCHEHREFYAKSQVIAANSLQVRRR